MQTISEVKAKLTRVVLNGYLIDIDGLFFGVYYSNQIALAIKKAIIHCFALFLLR